MKCIDCAYFEYDFQFGIVLNSCAHEQVCVPRTSNYEKVEHECDFYIKKSGISKWESYAEEEKKEMLLEFDKRYYNDEEFLKEMREECTFKELKEMLIENMKNTDKNRK